MDKALAARIEEALNKRKVQGNYRVLNSTAGLVDFISNDYLGLGRSEALFKSIEISHQFLDPARLNGSGGSRLLAGNSVGIEKLEALLAEFYEAPSALIFNSGYDANLALFSSVPQRGDTVIHDELIHASVIDGIRLSFANRASFKHNDLASLVSRIKHISSGSVFVAVESLYSMTGDFCPLDALLSLATKYSFTLVIDEAHSTGLYGDQGRGLFNSVIDSEANVAGGTSPLLKNHTIRLHTFGKAAGIHGAAFLLPLRVKEFLVNFARPFIYSTSLPPYQLAAIHEAHTMLKEATETRNKLNANINLYESQFERNIPASRLLSQKKELSPIKTIRVKGNHDCLKLAKTCREAGFNVKAILSPTVAQGQEQLRICLHSFNTTAEILGLTGLLNRKLHPRSENCTVEKFTLS